MKVKRILLGILCCLVILSTSVLPTAFASANYSDYDYSREGSYFNTVLTSADILELLGYSVSAGERAYLDAYGDLNVRYEIVTNQYISVGTIDGDTVVTALPYTYTGANGERVVWTPISVSIEDVHLPFTTTDGTVYSSNLGHVDLTDESFVNVKYEMNEVTVSADDVNRVINLAYTEAVSLREEMLYYRANLDEIASYIDALSLYEANLKEIKVYDEKKAKYDAYVVESQRYESDSILYEEYLSKLEAYMYSVEYPTLVQKYDEDKAKYDKYIEDLKLVDEQLKILNDGLMGTSTYLNRQLYGCFFADLVDEVVAQKDKLTKIGASEEDINRCETASKNIRRILKPADGKHYTDLKTTEEKYAFYVNNYEALRDNIITLAVSFYSLYTVPTVKPTMHFASNLYGREDYTERFAIFIAQLIYFGNALSDEPIYCDGEILDGSVKLSYRRLSDGVDFDDVIISDLLADENGEIFVTDTNRAAPISLVEVKEPIYPETPTVTVMPDAVARPIEPSPVDHPGERPEELDVPIRPDCVPEDITRVGILENEVYLSLVSDLEQGLLTPNREERTGSFTYAPTVILTKKINVTDIVEVTFLDVYGNVLTTLGAEKGSSVNFTDELPTKPEDISATYAFASWVDESGEMFDFSSVDEDVVLYPSFRPNYKEYGTVDKGMAYLDVSVTDQVLTDVPLAHFLEVAKASHLGILITADNVTLALPYTVVLDLLEVGTDRFEIFLDTSTIGSYSCFIVPYGADGHLVPHVSGISVSIPCSDETFARDSVLSYLNGDGKANVASKSYSAGMITFTATTRTNYFFTLRYSISSNSNLADKVTAPDGAIPGESVTLTLTIPSGMKAELYYVLLSDLSKHPIEGDSFVMPYGDVRLGATFTELEYTVKFVSDGKVISERTYKYGETVRIPNAPVKVNDAEYSYAFIGWSPEVSDVTGDAVYEAQFEATPLPKAEKKVSMFNVLFYSGLTVFILLVLLALFLLLKKIGVIKLGKSSKKEKNKSTRVEDNATEEKKISEEIGDVREE